jgi:hypothetical protein
MGQYYKPVFLKEVKPKSKEDVKGWFYSHNHKTTHTRPDGTKFTSGHGMKLMEHSYVGNRFVGNVERHLSKNPEHLVWAGDYADGEDGVTLKDDEGDVVLEGANIYFIAEGAPEMKPNVSRLGKKWRYIVNHTKKEFVDKEMCPTYDGHWQVHPLPLLTCEGNNRGGGDFRNRNFDNYVGRWSRDLISVESRKPEGFEEINPNFVE